MSASSRRMQIEDVLIELDAGDLSQSQALDRIVAIAEEDR